MRAFFIVGVVAAFLLPWSEVAASPKAKEKLDALKKRLPGVVGAWDKSTFLEQDYAVVLRRVRSTSDTEAKIAIHLYYQWKGKRDPAPQYIVTVWLKYHDGFWTVVRSEWSVPDIPYRWRSATHSLLDAIDEAGDE